MACQAYLPGGSPVGREHGEEAATCVASSLLSWPTEPSGRLRTTGLVPVGPSKHNQSGPRPTASRVQPHPRVGGLTLQCCPEVAPAPIPARSPRRVLNAHPHGHLSSPHPSCDSCFPPPSLLQGALWDQQTNPQTLGFFEKFPEPQVSRPARPTASRLRVPQREGRGALP